MNFSGTCGGNCIYYLFFNRNRRKFFDSRRASYQPYENCLNLSHSSSLNR